MSTEHKQDVAPPAAPTTQPDVQNVPTPAKVSRTSRIGNVVTIGTAITFAFAFATLTIYHDSIFPERATGKGGAQAIAAAPTGNPDHGKELFLQTCAACHGPNAGGQPHIGANLRESRFIASQTDDQLLAFIKTGRMPGDPKSVMNLMMPARGGNMTLDEPKLRDIIAFLRNVQSEAKASASAQ